MARPFKNLTETQRAEVETLAAVLTTEQMADYFGIGRTTFFSIMDRDPDIAERYKKGKARAIGAIAQSLISKARSGDTTSMIFYLKTQAGWRETNRIEHSATMDVPAGLSSSGEKLMGLLDKICERQISPEAVQDQQSPVTVIEHQADVAGSS